MRRAVFAGFFSTRSRVAKAAVLLSLTMAWASLFANGRTQDRVTLNERNALLETVLKEIQQQSGYQYFMMDKWKQVANRIDIAVSNVSISEALDICFRNQPFTYSIINKIIVVGEKSKPSGASPEGSASAGLEVKGSVQSETGSPLSGATVALKGTTKGGVTDNYGQFLLRGINPGKYVLQVSFVGYNPFERSIEVESPATEVMAVLKQASGVLDETRVIAYGTTTRRTAIMDIPTVKAADIEKQPVTNPLLAMAGRVPGVFISQASGFAGSGVTVRIQGINSIGSGNDPLYVVDGVPYLSQLMPSLSTTQGGSGGKLVNGAFASYGNPLSFINPADIESIEVLKDADATAIYGSRAANGAVLISTKKGKAGDQKIEFNIQQGIGKVGRRMDLFNPQQYLDMRYEGLKNDGVSLASGSPTNASFYDLMVWDTTHSTDWQKVLIGNAAQYTDAQATVSGGNVSTSYSIGAGYHRETTVAPGDFNDQKGSLHFQLNSSSKNQKFRIRLASSYMADFNRLPYNADGSDLTWLAVLLPPNAPALYNKDGSINWAPDPAGNSTWSYPGNPVAALLNKYQNNTSNMVNNLLLSYQLIPGLYLKSSFGYTHLQTNEKVEIPLTSTAPELRANTTRQGTYGNSSADSWIIEPQISYDRHLAQGKLEALVGSTIQENNSQAERIYGYGYTTDAAIGDIHSAATLTAAPTIDLVYKYNALFGRLNYNWQNKYIVSVTARRDGSSRFGPDSRFHNFGSAGAAWAFTEEEFVKKKLPLLSFGKLSVSYGTTGNDQIGEYQYFSQYNPVTYGVPYQGINGLQANNLSNPYLQWEETRKASVALNLGFFDDRIVVNVDYFRNRTSNQLLAYQLPITTGFSNISANFPAVVQNDGWEFSVSSTNLKGKRLSWSTNFNLTVPRNKLIAFPGLETSTYANTLVIGKPITVARKFHMAGVDPANGLYFFESKTNPYNPVFPDDANVLINTAPVFYGGLQNSIGYAGFQLDFLFQFVKQTGPNYFLGQLPGASRLNQPAYVLNRWRSPGDVATHQLFDANFSYSQTFGVAKQSDAAYSDASYIRLKNVSLSWQAPERIVKAAHLRGLRIFVQGQNLLTFTKYKGLDPETTSSISLPPLRVVTAGMKVTL